METVCWGINSCAYSFLNLSFSLMKVQTHSSVLIIAVFEGNIESFHEKNIGIN